MTDPATFIILPSGRMEIMLGTQLAGIIEPWDGPHIGTGHGHVGAYFWITLPIDGGSDVKRPAPSPQVARWLILKKLADWFDAAGPLFGYIVETLAAQAQMEREALDAPALLRR